MQFIQSTHSYAATGFVQAYQTPSNRATSIGDLCAKLECRQIKGARRKANNG